MNTNTQPPSPSTNQAAGHTNAAAWKHQFRLNALDLEPMLRAPDEQLNWITTEPQLMRALADMRRDLEELNQLLATAGESTLPTHQHALLRMLGVARETAPAGLLDKLQFSAKFLVGLWRFQMNLATARLGQGPSWRPLAP